jgi:4-hydroxy-tetrahydrodipicolinate reductase
LKKEMAQIETVLRYKVPIVSTTEEMVYPCGANVKLAARIDRLAREAGVAVVGTGVNPGFIMDALPIALTSACKRVDAIRIERVQDARCRRFPFQQKIGSSLTVKEFWRKVKEGDVRHVGLAESISMIADSIGWKLDRIIDEIHPKIAEKEVSSEFFTVPKGSVCGIIQDGFGMRGSKPLVVLHMEAYIGAPNPYEATTIEGEPSLTMRINGGVHGDIATASIALNAIPKVLLAQPGFRTMREMFLPSFFGGFGTKSKG